MYFLPFQQQVRFCALKDEPAVEAELATWTTLDHTWDELFEHPLLSTKMVDGDAELGVFFKRDKTFITNGVGLPQIKFEENPRSLLFIYSFYTITGSSSSFSYSKIHPGYFRAEISPHYYSGDEESLEGVWEGINAINTDKADKEEINQLKDLVALLRGEIDRLRIRQDPSATVLPALASQSETINAKLRDLQLQVDQLQPQGALGTLEFTNYYTKEHIDYLLTQFATTGYVDTKFASAASQTDLDNHTFDTLNTDHKVTYSQVGAPSRAEFTSLADRVNDIEDQVFNLQAAEYIQTLTGAGGILPTDEGNGVWNVDASEVPQPFLAVILNTESTANQAVFTLTGTPDNVTLVYVDGLYVQPQDYSIVGNTLTFDTPLSVGKRVVVIAG